MNYTRASCGHYVPAVGPPESAVRRRAERRHCGRPRCASGLPSHFSDDECDAWMYLTHCDIREWAVDMLHRHVTDWSGESPVQFAGLVEFAKHHGWQHAADSKE